MQEEKSTDHLPPPIYEITGNVYKVDGLWVHLKVSHQGQGPAMLWVPIMDQVITPVPQGLRTEGLLTGWENRQIDINE